MALHRNRTKIGTFFAIALAAGCGDGSTAIGTSTTSGTSDVSSGASMAGTGGTGAGGTDFNPAGVGGSSTNTGGGSEDLCDGIDNDGDGIVDNVDVGGDGVCDCLRIATLGTPGHSGADDVFADWLDARSNNGAVNLGAAELTPQELDKYQVLVAQDLSTNGRAYSADEVAALNAWIEGGGGLLTLIGYTNDSNESANVNALLAPMGVSYGPEHILQKQGGMTVPITEWVPHPTSNGVTAVGVDNGYPVEGTLPTLASGGGYAMAKAGEIGKGHVYVWGDEWITYDSEWVSHPDYQVELFWLNLIKWLTEEGECQVPIVVPE